MELLYVQNQKKKKYAIGAEHSTVTFQEKKKKRKKNFIFGWYMPNINKTPIHHIAQLMNMLKPTLHFPIEDARSIS